MLHSIGKPLNTMAVAPNKLIAYGRNPDTNRPEPVSASDDGNGLSVDDTYLRRYEAINDPRNRAFRYFTTLLSATRLNLATSANDPLFLYNKAASTRTIYVQHIHVHVSSVDTNYGTVAVEIFRVQNHDEATIGGSTSGVQVFNQLHLRQDTEDTGISTFNNAFDVLERRRTTGTLNTSSSDKLFTFTKRFYAGGIGTNMDIKLPLEDTQIEVAAATGITIRVSFSNSSQVSTICASMLYRFDDGGMSNNSFSYPVTELEFLEEW